MPPSTEEAFATLTRARNRDVNYFTVSQHLRHSRGDPLRGDRNLRSLDMRVSGKGHVAAR